MALPKLAPMLATPGVLPAAADDDRWAYEMKWDGVRALVRVFGGALRLTSRNDLDMTPAYPELSGLANAVDRPVLLDGEIVAFDDQGRPSFSRLQRRMHVRGHSVKALQASDPVVLLIFDLLYAGDRPLLDEPYWARREQLAALNLGGRAWQVPPAFHGSGAKAVAASKSAQLEGVVAKRLASTYQPGRRSGDWLKIKNIRMQEVVVGGWKPGAGSRAGRVGSLLLGIPDGDQLRYVGKVGTGFTAATLEEMAALFARRTRKTSPFGEIPRPDARDAQWVRPDMVGEVSFAEWTPDQRLRHPAWRGWRDDKRPDQVIPEGR